MLIPSVRNSLFDDWFNDFDKAFDFPRTNENIGNVRRDLMRTDVKENDDSFELTIDIPGVNKEDVKAELQDGYLTISAVSNQSSEEKDKTGRYIRRERYQGKVQRTFFVGDEVEKEDIRAKFENGVLLLTVPKKEAKKELPEDRLITIE